MSQKAVAKTITLCNPETGRLIMSFTKCYKIEFGTDTIVWLGDNNIHHILKYSDTIVHISEIPLDEMGVLPGSVEPT